MTWTRFMDMHSGGSAKRAWEFIYVEAPVEEATRFFIAKFGTDPDHVTCPCRGEDYSVSEGGETLEQATAYDRHYDGWTLAEYIAHANVHVVFAREMAA